MCWQQCYNQMEPEGSRNFSWGWGFREGRRVALINRFIDANTVEVSAPEIGDPKFVRFGWHSLARYNLVNSDDLPAVSFKSDPQDHHRR